MIKLQWLAYLIFLFHVEGCCQKHWGKQSDSTKLNTYEDAHPESALIICCDSSEYYCVKADSLSDNPTYYKYDPTTKKAEDSYVQFLSQGCKIIFNQNHQIIVCGFHVNGRLYSGMKYKYNEVGILISKTKYENGIPAGGE